MPAEYQQSYAIWQRIRAAVLKIGREHGFDDDAARPYVLKLLLAADEKLHDLLDSNYQAALTRMIKSWERPAVGDSDY